MRHLFVLAALLWSAAIAFAADPVGTYSVEGSNPGGGSKYTGAVTVEQTGETYRVTGWSAMYALLARASAIRISSRFPTVPAATLDWRSIARMVAIGTESGPMPAGARWGPKSGNANSLENRE
jgi:hypothetical protein